MISKKIQRLIALYLDKQATQSERNELEMWLEKKENFNVFEEYIKANFLITSTMNMFDTNESKKQLLELIHKDKKVYKLRQSFQIMKYAAMVIIFLGLGYIYQKGYFNKTPEVVIPANSITLQLENGTIEILTEDGTTQVIDADGKVVGSQKGKQLIYDKNATVEELVYNTLTIPFGKQFQVQLSDGTKVNLNAGSSLKYPVKFLDGNQRQVFLTGEAYFDVTADKDHPFIVNAEQLNVQVLGTMFNISAYPEDKDTDVVLVEGSVGLYAQNATLDQSITIKPGTKGTLDKTNNSITTETVDISIYTSWMNGDMVFRNMPFENIVKKLERQFNMTIIITNEKLKREYFNATFNDEPTIEHILNAFGKSYGIEYNIKNNAIFIK